MNSQPNVSIPATSTLSVMGEAPYTRARSVEKSVVSTPGVASRNWMTAGTMNALVTP